MSIRAASTCRRATYYLDSAFNLEGSTGYQYIYSSGTPGCMDTGQTSIGIAYMYARTFAKQAFNSANNGNLKLDTRVFNGGPNKVHALAYSLERVNIPFPGMPCHNLGINPNGMLVFTKLAGNTGYAVNRMAFPYLPSMDNVRLYMQVAWDDSVKNTLMLSRQSLVQLQKQPAGMMRVVYQAGTGTANLNGAMQRIPLTRYTFQ
jgi:hypothetical protein